MKNSIITLLLSLLCIPGFSQDLHYTVRGYYAHPVIREDLIQARTMSDLIPYYPVNWIMGYESVEISTILDDKTVTVAGKNDTLNAEQLNMLNNIEMGSEIVIDIRYKSNNMVHGKPEIREMNYSATVVPATEAEFAGGYEQMMQYLEEKVINNISETVASQLQQAIVIFTVNEKGEIANAQISRTSGDQETDDLLLEAINKMPKWKAAENINGNTVKQVFEFSVSGANFGC